MHQQQGSDPLLMVGGFFPSLAGFSTLLADPSLTAAAPSYTSTLFGKTGVVLRNHYPSERESYLHFIAGENHSHYDMDSGSIVVWGKGRIVADDFGYEGGMPGDDHSMVTSPIARDSDLMRVNAFSTTATMDYVRGGRAAGRGKSRW